jgi:hypothetical protein
MAAAAILSLSIKSDIRRAPEKATSHEINIQFASMRLSTFVKPATKVVNNYRLSHITRTAETKTKLTPAQIASSEVTPQEFYAWSKVNVCEEGGNWHVNGPKYSGGLGINKDNWVRYHGTDFAPIGSEATPDEQIVVGERIQPDAPDQNGCSKDGW